VRGRSSRPTSGRSPRWDGKRSRALAEAEEAGVRTVVEVLPQKPAQALIDAAHRHDGRVIVVGTRGESPLRGAVLGSVSHKLLHLSDRPVLCVPAA
jgi:nucleotide-binding universal stress UspA family protein